MQKYDLTYEDLDIVNNPEIYAEMVRKSGQPLSPCVEIDGIMLSDVSGEEVEAYMLHNNLVSQSTREANAPINQACSDEEHQRMASQTVRLF
jgi:monothiol glutaredoxin